MPAAALARSLRTLVGDVDRFPEDVVELLGYFREPEPGQRVRAFPGAGAAVFAAEPGYVGFDTYDVLHQRVVSHHVRFAEGPEARLFRSPHRYIWPAELDMMAQLAGFDLESRHADWYGSEFTADSRPHVSVYRLGA